jgi:DNA mismatch repair protein MutS
MAAAQASPMLEQYRRIKKEQQGNILFFRLGDFYEMFAEDAIEVSALLNLTLTSRNGLPMCGVPYHAARAYMARLLKLGKKIAVCEQLAQPGKVQKVIEREVVEVITPGTTVDEEFLDKGSSNYLCCLALYAKFLSFSYIDLSTGEFFTTCFPPRETAAHMLRQELERLQIREMLVQESLLEEDDRVAAAIYDRSGLVLNRWADWLFDPVQAKARLQKQFGVANLKSFGLDDGSVEIVSAGTLLDYLDATSRGLLPHVRTIKVYRDNEYLGIDESSQRNLELVCNQRDGDIRFSLLEVMDETRCAMGRRLLKRRILHPLRDLCRIESRLDMVEGLYRDQGRLGKLRELLGRTPDLERLCSRIAMDKAHARDMLAVKNALACCQKITELGAQPDGNLETEEQSADLTLKGVGVLKELEGLLEKGICEDPSTLLNEGNLIKAGYSAELDQLRSLRDKGRSFLENYLEEERVATGITSLKLRYNRLIGYFFEVTKTHLQKAPSYFIRRQGIAGGERFTTDRLAALESEINGASERVVEIERKLFIEIREQAKLALEELAAAACHLAELDFAQSLAKAASIRGWTRPELEETGVLEIYEGRHPVVEAHMSRGEYMPNDVLLNTGTDGASFALITGPNMAGKSTYLRQAALITLMAQMGSFVPAREARIGICDRIYCRVGAQDNLARGESTFLVEMNECAFILNTATEKSLVIMDEVGRGTGTNDGLSIAWAVSEELLNQVGCRTIFATHFHELSLLSHPRLANRSMEVLDNDGKIVFLRKLKEGPSSESYGIHVAKLAGLSQTVLARAGQIMELLKERDADIGETFHHAGDAGCNLMRDEVKLCIKDASLAVEKPDTFELLLRGIDPEQMTPVEALNLLSQWKKLVSTGVNFHPIQKLPKHRGNKSENTPSLFN